jgi:hypothetical protein
MHISADLLVDLLGKTVALFEGGGEFDISKRLPSYRITADHPHATRPSEPVKICNISSRGLGIMQTWPMEPGQHLKLSLATADDGIEELEAVVSWCRPTCPGSYLVAAEFIEAEQAALRLRAAA